MQKEVLSSERIISDPMAIEAGDPRTYVEMGHIQVESNLQKNHNVEDLGVRKYYPLPPLPR